MSNTRVECRGKIQVATGEKDLAHFRAIHKNRRVRV
jgi:hypothetical protein